VRILGGTIAPLQGTAERVGRIMDRFPGGRRRPPVEGTVIEAEPQERD
jgi:hypothetical protein